MRVGSLNHVQLTVNELQKSRAFYDRLLPDLGYRLIFEAEDSFGFRAPDGMRLMFAQAHAKAKFDRYHVGLHHLAFEAPDRSFVDAVHAKLAGWGATILDKPAEYPQYQPGYYAVFFLDPDGIKLEVVHAPREGSPP